MKDAKDAEVAIPESSYHIYKKRQVGQPNVPHTE